MSDGIDLKYDMVLGSTKREDGSFETDWHGLTKGVEVLDDKAVEPCMFDIKEDVPFVEIDGIRVPNPEQKMLIADLRGCRPDLAVDGVFGPDAFVPLHTPKKSYRTISNRQVWDAAKASIEGLEGAEIERVFTLERLTKFGVSIRIGEREIGVQRFNGTVDKTLCQLNVITSHDGSMACEAYDSTIRIVCMNTLRWSRDAAGDVGFKVYHTKNSDQAMVNFPKLLNAILTGRVRFKNQMEYFDNVALSKDEALYLALLFVESQKNVVDKSKADIVSTRNMNTAESIQNLFVNGKGNLGATAYDLLCGVTEHYTGGNGTGEKATNADKAYRAEFGKAAEHKENFVNFLMSIAPLPNGDKSKWLEAIEKGRKTYVKAMASA